MFLSQELDKTQSTQTHLALRAILNRYRNAIGAASLVALTACGGGGGSDPLAASAPGPAPVPGPAPSPAPTPPPAPPLPLSPPILPAATTDPKVVAGFWSARVDAQTTVSSVFLPEGQAWTVFQATTGTGGAAVTTATLARGAVSVANNGVTVAGSSYTFSSPLVVSSYQLNGTFVPKSAIDVPAIGILAAFTWGYNAAYEVPAKLSDAAGRWNASVAGGAIKVAFDISVLGALTGTSTTGCTYTGSVVPHPANIAVFNLTLNEACLNLPVRSYSGITTVNAAATSLSAAFVTADGVSAGLLAGVR